MRSPNSNRPQANILIVDDSVPSLKAILAMLRAQGFEVQGAPGGPTALKMIEAEPPDLILLDVNMPDMDGYELCQQLKDKPETQDIPVIFISGLAEVVDKVKGFAIGGVDYISKPFQVEEVIARIETHLTLRNLQKSLKAQNVQLQQEIVERKRAETELQQAHDALEQRVKERTVELLEANAQLQEEIAERKQMQVALKESETHYRLLIENIPSVIWETDREGKTIFISPNVQEIYGFTREEILEQGKTLWFDRIHPDDANSVKNAFDLLFSQQTPFDIEYRIQSKDEQWIWLHDSATIVEEKDGQLYAYGVFSDITERKQAAEALQQYTERLRILHEIDQGILAAQSPEEIAEAALSHLRQLLSYHRAAVTIFNSEATEAETIAVDADIETKIGKGTRWPLTRFQDEIERLRQGQIIFQEQNPLLLSQPGQVVYYDEGLRWTIYIPLLAQGKLIGELGLSMRHRREWSPEQEAIARQVADQLAIAIQQARLFEAEAERRQEAETLREATAALTSALELDQVLDNIMTHLKAVVPYDSTCLFLQEDGHLRAVAGRGFSNPEKVLGLSYPLEKDMIFHEIKQTGDPIIVADVQVDPRFLHWGDAGHVRGWMGIPLIVSDEVIGHLTLDSRQVAAYGEEEANLAQAFANQAAIAIENARLFEAERRQREIAEILRETSAAVTSSLDLGQVLLTLAKQLREISGFHRCILYGWEPGSNYVYELAEHARSVWSIEGGRTYHLADYPVIERVLTSNQPEITHIGMTDADEAELVLMRAIGVTALMTLPLYAGEQTIGLIEVGAVTSGLTFDQTTLTHCQQFLQEAALWLKAPIEVNPQKKLHVLAKQLLEVSGGSLCILSTWHSSEGFVRTAAEYSDLVWPPGAGPIFDLEDHPTLAAVLKQNESVVRPGNPAFGVIEQEPLAQWGERTLVVHPLSVKRKPLGLAELIHFTEEKMVSDEELRLWRAVTDQATIAIENAGLYERVQHYTKELEQRVVDRSRELSVLYDVTAVASEALDLQTTLERALERVLAAIKSNAGLIHLLDETKETLNLVVQQELPLDLVAQIATISSTTGLGKHLIEDGEPLIVPDITSDRRMAEISYIGPPQTYVALPMRASGGIVGVLSILREATQPQINVEEMTLLTSIADQVGVVVESTRLRQRAEQTAVLEERARLARELHDSVTQLLYSMNLFVKSGQNAFNFDNMNEVNNCLAELGDIAQQALKEMRLLVYELRPPGLEQDGLVGALQHRLDAVEGRAGVVTQLLTNRLMDLPGRIEQELYYIALEALNNALKHAKATSVTVKIEADQDQIKLDVIDNGSGFDLDQVVGRGGLGLVSMRERTVKLGGKLTILPVLEQGTTISVSVEVFR